MNKDPTYIQSILFLGMYERHSNLQVAGPVDRTSTKVGSTVNRKLKNVRIVGNIKLLHNQYFNLLFSVYKHRFFLSFWDLFIADLHSSIIHLCNQELLLSLAVLANEYLMAR